MLGSDFAGLVDEVGAGVTSLGTGDDVLGYCPRGAHAELIVVNASDVARRPATLPWPVAGGPSASGQTALNALRDLDVCAGETLLVHAAADGVGTVAVQLAREWGATVSAQPARATTATSRRWVSRRWPMAPVSSTGSVPWPQGVDVVLDCIGGDAVPASLDLGVDRTRVGTIADYLAVRKYGVRRRGGQRSAGNLRQLIDAHTADRLELPMHAALPLERAADAHRDVETGHVRGKVVLLGLSRVASASTLRPSHRVSSHRSAGRQ